MFINCCQITIEYTPGKVALDFVKVNEIEINESKKDLTTTCLVKLPRRINILNGNINDVIKRGSKISVKMGYDYNLVEEFTGYVARVNAEIPFTIECEDQMWLLKQKVFTRNFGKVKVSEIVKHIWDGPADVVDLTIGSFVVKEMSGAKILEQLKKYGLRAYFKLGVLIVDFAASKRAGKRVAYNFKRNIIDPKLKYSRQDDQLIRVKGISKFKDGSIIEVYAGDKGGDLRTLNYSSLDKKDLEKVVKNEIDRLKYDGYKGSFTTFGLPVIHVDDTAVLNDPDWPERAGSYQVESVKVLFNMAGYRREVSPERRIA